MAEEQQEYNGEEMFLEGGMDMTDPSVVEQVGDDQNGGEANPGDRINASKNDDDERKIFVGGLSWETTVKDLREYFVKFGEVLDTTLKTDPSTGRSRGFGFVLFGESTSVDKVLAEDQHTLHGRNIDPKRAKARGGREPVLKVFVGGLEPSVPESEIKEYFETKYGKVTDIDLPFDKQKNQRRAFCFVTFETEEIVDKVCEQPKQTLGDKQVDVKKATPKNDQWGYNSYGYGGGYGGGRGGGGGGRGGSRGRGGYNQGAGWGNQAYNYDYYNNGQNYDYNSYYGNYGNYDYNNYYNQGWGNYNYNQGYGSGYGSGYDYSGWGYGNNSQGGAQPQVTYGKQKTSRGGSNNSTTATSGATSSGNNHGYHPYSR